MKRLISLTSIFLASPSLAEPLETIAGCRDGAAQANCQSDFTRLWAYHDRSLGAESLSERGASVRRALFIDRTGASTAGVVFQRWRGEAPTILFKRSYFGNQLAAPLPLTVWNEAVRRSRRIDEARPFTGSVVGCDGRWSAHLESADARGSAYWREPSRRTVELCGESRAVRFATWMAEQALRALPRCGAPEPARVHPVEQLGACADRELEQGVIVESGRGR